MIRLSYLGFTRQNAPLPLRERLHWDIDGRNALQRELADLFGGCLILTTCERVEFYVTAARPDADVIHQTLANRTDVAGDQLRAAASTRVGFDAAGHLIRIAAGLESRIVGEPHILRQVRQSYLRAKPLDVLGPVLDALARGAIHAGKVVRRDIYSPGVQPSLARSAVKTLLSRGITTDSAVVLVGTGGLALELLDELTRGGIGHVTIVSRQLKRAEHVCRSQTHRPAAIAHLPAVIARADAVIACAKSDSPLIDAGLLAHRTRPITIIDLGVPRNVHPQAAAAPAVQLTHLEDLSARRIDVETRRTIESAVRRELERFKIWCRARSRAHLIARCEANSRQPIDRAARGRKYQSILRIKEHAA